MIVRPLSLFVCAFLVALVFCSPATAANPGAPITPSMNIQDPGAPTTPWGGCGPADPNCYVDLNAGTGSFASLTVAGSSALTGPTSINTTGAAVTTIGNAAATTTIAGTTQLTGGVTFTALPTLPLSNGSMLLGNASNVATSVALAGDASLSNAGVLTISNAAVTLAKLAADSVNSAKIVDATITDADIATTAAIAYSKLTLGNAIVLSDLTGNSVDSSKIVDGTIVAADLATGAVTSAKILDGTIANGDLADDVLDFDKLQDQLDLDADTDIAVGGNTLSITNDGAGLSFRVNDTGAADATPFIVDATGNVSIAATSNSDSRLQINNAGARAYTMRLTTTGNDALGLAPIISNQTHTTTTTGLNSVSGPYFQMVKKVAAGQTDSGYALGLNAATLRNHAGTTADSGTLGVLYGARLQYGHSNVDPAATPITTNVIGLDLAPSLSTGTINNLYDLYLHAGGSGATVTNRYGVYQESTAATNYFAGKVGIGTFGPSAQLHTTGTVRFAGLAAGTLTTDASGNVTVSSDERLKAIDGTYLRGLDDLMLVTPIRYHWRPETGLDPQSGYAGFSAQNVLMAIPEAVGEDRNGYLTLQDRPILATLVNAVKDIGSLGGRFRDSLVTWLAAGDNGIGAIAAHEICLSDAQGRTTCIDKAALDAILARDAARPDLSTQSMTTTPTENPAQDVPPPQDIVSSPASDTGLTPSTATGDAVSPNAI